MEQYIGYLLDFNTAYDLEQKLCTTLSMNFV